MHELRASAWKELLIALRSWRVLAYGLFLAAVVLLGASLPDDGFPYELALSQGPLLVLLVLGCVFIFTADSVSRERERGTAALVFGTPASRGILLWAKAVVPATAWLLTLAALAASYLSQGLGAQFAALWLVHLLTATVLFVAVLALMLLVSAAVRGRGASFAGLIAALFVFFSSGYLPVGLSGNVMWLNPGYCEYMTASDLMDGRLDSPLPLMLLVAETLILFGLAYLAFRRSEVSA
jgi:ABC-2 type transport system permease protein